MAFGKGHAPDRGEQGPERRKSGFPSTLAKPADQRHAHKNSNCCLSKSPPGLDFAAAQTARVLGQKEGGSAASCRE